MIYSKKAFRDVDAGLAACRPGGSQASAIAVGFLMDMAVVKSYLEERGRASRWEG
jgi:hypothetical protein